jgi:hypothetical protein
MKNSGIVKKYLYKRFPRLQKFWIAFNIKPKFAGWDMITHAELPWNDQHCSDVNRFLTTSAEIKKGFEFCPDVGIDVDNIDGLMWRHYIVTFAVRYALKFFIGKHFTMIEAGVADGISAFFALREAAQICQSREYVMHLYDSWSAMRRQELLTSEYDHIGHYVGLNIERTKKNLDEFKEHTVYHQGYVPESLKMPPLSPQTVNFMHIDINAAIPTKELLDFFWYRLEKNAVILFDDYGWSGYDDMREMIDAFFVSKSGILLKLPTGQAIYFHL